MKWLRFFCLVIVSCLSFASAAEAARRVALVMGNSEYTHAPGLANPANDARAMADLFRSLDFQVIEGTNLDRQAMASRIYAFANLASGADAAVFFYAGHGLSLDGKNYLIPVDADIRNETDVKLGSAIDAEISIDQALADAKVKIVLLDACRNNPFAQAIRSAHQSTRAIAVSPGLAEMKSGQGTLIAFATGPGQVALDGKSVNSPFTTALLQHIAEPGLEIRLAMTKVRAQVEEETGRSQTPWENTNLTGFFYMNTRAIQLTGTPDPNALASTTPTTGGDVEVEFWRSVKDTANPEELKAYLTRYPSGNFTVIARTRLAMLEAGPALPSPTSRSSETAPPLVTVEPPVENPVKAAEATQATEDALALSKTSRGQVQTRLDRLGFEPRSFDGVFGPKTRAAIAKWQTARNHAASGYLNQFQYDALVAEIALPSPAPKSRTVKAPVKPKVTAKPKKVAAKPQKRKQKAEPSHQEVEDDGPSHSGPRIFIGGGLPTFLCIGKHCCKGNHC